MGSSSKDPIIYHKLWNVNQQLFENIDLTNNKGENYFRSYKRRIKGKSTFVKTVKAFMACDTDSAYSYSDMMKGSPRSNQERIRKTQEKNDKIKITVFNFDINNVKAYFNSIITIEK